MLITFMYLVLTIRTSLKFRAVRNNLRKILTDRYAVSFHTTSTSGPELDSPETELCATVSTCIWAGTDQRGSLVYPVRRVDLSNWFSFPESVEDHTSSCWTLSEDEEAIQLHLTLERTSEPQTIATDPDSIMLRRFGRFLAWNRASHGVEVILQTDAASLFQLIVATFGNSRFYVHGGQLKIVQFDSIETFAEPTPFGELEKQYPVNTFSSIANTSCMDSWLSSLAGVELQSWQAVTTSVSMQPDIISSNDIKNSLEIADGTVVASHSRTDLLSSGSNSRNRSQLDLTDGIVSSLERDSSASSEDSHTTVHTAVKNGDYIQSPQEEDSLKEQLKEDAIQTENLRQVDQELFLRPPSPIEPPNDTEPPELVPPVVVQQAKEYTPNSERPPSVANGALLRSNGQPPSLPPVQDKLATKDTTARPKGTRTLRKSSFPSSKLRLGGDGPVGVASKPPNILVHSDSSSTMEYVIQTLNSLLEPHTYTIYPITTTQTIANSWQQSTALIIVAGTLDADVRKVLVDYFLHGGTVFSMCSDLLDNILPDSKTAEIRERELVSFSYRKWKQIKMLHHVFCYQLSPARKQFSLETEESGTLLPVSYVDATDMAGKLHSLTVEILAQEETWNTPSILEAHNRKTGGRAIFSQIHLELDPSLFQTSIDTADNALQNSNQLRYEILSDLLGGRIGLKLREAHACKESDIVYKNAYFLGKHEAKIEALNTLKDCMARPNVIQTKDLTLQFCGKSDNAPGPATESHLPVMIVHCPEDFSTLEYFENLTTNKIGRIGIYAPIISSSMLIVSNLTLTHGFMVIARHQTKGKGRNSNQWLSPPGCAMFSLQLHILMSSFLGQRLPIVQHLVAVAVVSAILSIPGYEHLNLGLKWPNDIYAYGTTKLGGSIFNTSVDSSSAVVNLGVGINLSNSKPTLCLNDVIAHYNAKHSTALPLLSYEKTFALIFNKLEELYERVQRQGVEELQQEYYRHWLHQDAEISMVDTGGESLQGTVVGIDDYGFLLVKKQPSGETVSVHPDGNSFDMMQGLIIPKYS
ncbi:biotin--protein ligase isoform X1 [Anopheles darlingi]|uniref:biotin--protein ligase isoform X1 n=2 Tax=Anopheles darlingi TaxID=43151 RepID=UPI002100260E|nr:biotin--protein ligase isoform X1 [Anopheles darlingi]